MDGMRTSLYWRDLPNDMIINEPADCVGFEIRMRIRGHNISQPNLPTMTDSYMTAFNWTACGLRSPASLEEEAYCFGELSAICRKAGSAKWKPPRDKQTEKLIRIAQDKADRRSKGSGYVYVLKDHLGRDLWPFVLQQDGNGITVEQMKEELATRLCIPAREIKFAAETGSLSLDSEISQLLQHGAQIRYRATQHHGGGEPASTLAWDEIGWSQPWTAEEDARMRNRLFRQMYAAHAELANRILRLPRWGITSNPGDNGQKEELLRALAGQVLPSKKRFTYLYNFFDDSPGGAADTLHETAACIGEEICGYNAAREARMVTWSVQNEGYALALWRAAYVIEGCFTEKEMNRMLSPPQYTGELLPFYTQWSDDM